VRNISVQSEYVMGIVYLQESGKFNGRTFFRFLKLVVSYLYPRLRFVEDELPDVVGEEFHP
jgi:hypothetical protein